MALTTEQLLLQMDILASKTDSNTNPNMVYKATAALNKALDPEFFTGNNTKIVNAINKLAKDALTVTELSQGVANKVNELLIDTSVTDNQAIWENVKELMEKPNIVQGLEAMLQGEHADKILGLNPEDVGKVLAIDVDDNGNAILTAIEQAANEGNESVLVNNIAYENRYVSSITNVKEALDYAINEIANGNFDGGLGGGTIVGEITWDMINDRPAVVADGIVLTGTHLELKEGQTTVSSVPLVSDKDIEEVVAVLEQDQEEE